MHVFEHFNGSRPHGYIEIIEDIIVGPDQIPTKSFKVIFDHIQIGLDTLLSLCQFILFGYVLIYSVHELIVLTGFLVELNTQIEEHELENVFTVLLSEVAELFVQGLSGWGKGFGCRLN
jgi:hypothetical protein